MQADRASELSARVRERIDTLTRSAPIPGGWSLADPFSEVLDLPCGSTVHLFGLVASRGLQEVHGSAVGSSLDDLDRAYFELIERIVVVSRSPGGAESPAAWRASLSNGVAIGRTQQQAEQNAALELIERDAVLRAWFGGGELIQVSSSALESKIPPTWRSTHEWITFDLPSISRYREQAAYVSGTIALPRGSAPAALGFGASLRADEARLKSVSECMQVMAFLSTDDSIAIADSVPSQEGALPGPALHQEALLLTREGQARLRDWIKGRSRPLDLLGKGPEAPIELEDITPAEAEGRYRVARATCRSLVPLYFGTGHPWIDRSLRSQLPAHAALHPIF